MFRMCMASACLDLDVFSQRLQGIKTPSKWFASMWRFTFEYSPSFPQTLQTHAAFFPFPATSWFFSSIALTLLLGRRFASSQALSLERRFSWARRGGGNRGTGRGGGWEGSNPHMVPSKKEKPGVATVSPLFSHQANWKKLNMIQGYQQVNMLQLLLDVTIHWSAPNIHHCLVWGQNYSTSVLKKIIWGQVRLFLPPI